MHPKHLDIHDFTYQLPDDRIAKYPLPQRDESKLLLYKNGAIGETSFANLPQHLPEKSLLVFNNSKVIEARLLFQKPTGGHIEIFTLEPAAMDVTMAMQQQGSIDYVCLVGGLNKWKSGPLIKVFNLPDGTEVELIATLINKRGEDNIIRLAWQPAQVHFAEILHGAGNIPLPPYLQRATEKSDAERYQTIYAKADGSVAAPTAGLHFTDAVMQGLIANKHATAFVTLHVGAGTFKPVKSDTIGGHHMHAEYIDVTQELIQNLIENDWVIAVGTTSMRTLETLYWMGVKAIIQPNISASDIEISQWELYDELIEKANAIDKKIALLALINWMKIKDSNRLICKTQILIAPGYPFKICKGIITNFHQPQSTLLLLIAALVGPDWKKIYAFALQNNFRFLSYGDSSLLLV